MCVCLATIELKFFLLSLHNINLHAIKMNEFIYFFYQNRFFSLIIIISSINKHVLCNYQNKEEAFQCFAIQSYFLLFLFLFLFIRLFVEIIVKQ